MWRCRQGSLVARSSRRHLATSHRDWIVPRCPIVAIGSGHPPLSTGRQGWIVPRCPILAICARIGASGQKAPRQRVDDRPQTPRSRPSVPGMALLGHELGSSRSPGWPGPSRLHMARAYGSAGGPNGQDRRAGGRTRAPDPDRRCGPTSHTPRRRGGGPGAPGGRAWSRHRRRGRPRRRQGPGHPRRGARRPHPGGSRRRERAGVDP